MISFSSKNCLLVAFSILIINHNIQASETKPKNIQQEEPKKDLPKEHPLLEFKPIIFDEEEKNDNPIKREHAFHLIFSKNKEFLDDKSHDSSITSAPNSTLLPGSQIIFPNETDSTKK
jgi:hypothetical protein